MPLYEYACKSCDHHFEVLVRAGEKPRCPSCDGAKLEKLFSTFAVNASDGGAASRMAAGPCGSCPESRGPGGCKLN